MASETHLRIEGIPIRDDAEFRFETELFVREAVSESMSFLMRNNQSFAELSRFQVSFAMTITAATNIVCIETVPSLSIPGRSSQ
jgi:hypothetical protein